MDYVDYVALTTITNIDDGPLRFFASSTRIEISAQPSNRDALNLFLASAKDWNTTNGFTRPITGEKRNNVESASWWKRKYFGPICRVFAETFGSENNNKVDTAGNQGISYLRLSKPPGREIVVSVALAAGDKSISLVEGSRLLFDDWNWNRQAAVVFQLDPKLRTETSALLKCVRGTSLCHGSLRSACSVGTFSVFGIYHKFALPRPLRDRPGTADSVVAFLKEFFKTFGAFFRKERIGVLLLFLLFYRFAEAQLVKLVTPFLLDRREIGGLGLTTGQVGFVYGTIGILALTCGGLLGGMLASRYGLKFWLWPMVLIMHLPDAVFVYLAWAQPQNFALINLCVAIEQFGYGFGFTAYMLYMIYIARGQHETAHYAICTGFMALGMMLPGMFSGWLQDIIGYQHFFVWVMLATIPGFLVVFFVPLDPEFGKKDKPA